MSADDFFHPAQRALQRAMASEPIARRIADTRLRDALAEDDVALVQAARFFFLASAAPDGVLDGSIKCGPAGFVEVADTRTLAFPDYDGNGMFRSLGNIQATRRVALLFVEFWGAQRKLRLQGHAQLQVPAPPRMAAAGAQAVVQVRVEHAFPNCPRYLPSLAWVADSDYVHALGREPLEPAWKHKPDLAAWVAPRRSW